MTDVLKVTIEGWENGAPIPEEYAFGIPADDAPMTFGANRSPAIAWSGAPAETQSFAIICHDPDVPSKADDVNKEGVTIPADLPRVDFYHWVLVDIPATRSGLPVGADSDGVTVKGKPAGPSAHGLRGINSYTDFLAGSADMAGDYGGYDGPCPPWNDELIHHYIFTVYALDVRSLALADRFTGQDALAAMQGHILAMGQWTGTYTLNPALR